jgi:hypothetical protein
MKVNTCSVYAGLFMRLKREKGHAYYSASKKEETLVKTWCIGQILCKKEIGTLVTDARIEKGEEES